MDFQKLEIIDVDIEAIVPYDRNAKIHTQEQIEAVKNSIEEFGFRNPVILWTNASGRSEIVAGHARVKAAKELGYNKVPCIYCNDLTDEQRRALVLVDNQTTMMTGWDDGLLSSEIDSLSAFFDVTDFGFDSSIISVDDEEQHAEVTDVEIPDTVQKRAADGDIWKLGRHRLFCGDSTVKENIERLLNGCNCDLCFTSPPYNVGSFKIGPTINHMYFSKGDAPVYNSYDDNKSDDEYAEFLSNALDAVIDFCDDVLFNIGYTATANHGCAEFLGRNAAVWGGCLIWKKNNAFTPLFDSQHGIMRNICEPIYFFNNRGQRKFKHPQWEKTEGQDNIIETTNAQNREYGKEHHATFPVELPTEILNRFCDTTVLDIFGGTGTTLVAAEQLGKTCFISEIDPHYCDIIIDRYEKLTGQKAEKE